MIRVLLFFCVIPVLVFGQLNPKNIEIIRDSYGVPHIYGKTDAETAYGLAWAHAEDDFVTIQKSYLAGNAILSRHLGLKGAAADFVSQLIESPKIINDQFNTLSPEFVQILTGYVEGLNAYALYHPKEILEQKLFPLTPQKALAYSNLQLFISNGADQLIGAITNNSVSKYSSKKNEDINGSNLIALSSKKTGENASYLAINTHQPLEGPTSWYEAHLVSDEGTNIIGATFPGAPCILTGANQYLGWTHTVNYPDKADIYSLEMHPKKKEVYLVDGKEYSLQKKKAKLHLKILGLKIPIQKKFYTSIYGPTLKNKTGYFAVRTPSTTNINALEQWWRMNKATSFSEFYNILKMKALPGYNIGYADRNDTIFYISNGKIPIRSEKYDWKKVVPGNTLKTLWNHYYDIEQLPQVIHPEAGFVYNANHSPFKSTSKDENPKPELFSKTMNYEHYDNNRSTRLLSLLEKQDTINYERFLEIKYDHTLPTPLQYSFMDINVLFEMEPEKYPDVQLLLERIQQWDRKTDIESLGAGTYAILYYLLEEYFYRLGPTKIFNPLLMYTALKKTKAYMIKHFNTLAVSLGDFQKLVRGNKEVPIFGLPDVVTAMKGIPYKEGKIKITHGESYIGLVRFTPNKTYYESIISFGNSNRSNSKHYTDQMELFAQFKTKTMSFDRNEVLKEAVNRYHPK